jgi:O-antigen ligase
VFPFLLGLYGKDLTFTGRTVIWRGCFRAIREQLWFGYGLGGVWSNPGAQPTKGILSQLGFIVFHAHNGYIELMLHLGLVGLFIWMAIAVGNLVNGVRLLLVHPQIGQWAMVFTIAVLMIAMSEVVVFGIWLATLAMMRVVTARELAQPHIWHHDLPHDPPHQVAADAPATTEARS